MPFHDPSLLIDEYSDRYSPDTKVIGQPVVPPDREGNLEGLHELFYVVVSAQCEDAQEPDSSALVGQIGPLKLGGLLLALRSPVRTDVDH